MSPQSSLITLNDTISGLRLSLSPNFTVDLTRRLQENSLFHGIVSVGINTAGNTPVNILTP